MYPKMTKARCLVKRKYTVPLLILFRVYVKIFSRARGKQKMWKNGVKAN